MTVRIDQMDLVVAISRSVEEQVGKVSILPRQFNAIIQAANLIVEAFEKPEQKVTDGMGVAAWLQSDHTGMSSLWILQAMCIRGGVVYAYPQDAGDFGRCLGLLRAAPELREKLGDVAATGKEWSILVENWKELEGLHARAAYPELSKRMSELLP